jgi:hypothetical protein
MAKYYGSVGYEDTVESTPGIFKEEIIPRDYYGDILQNNRKLENSGEINDSINVNNQISIVADPYALKNFGNMRYITWMNSKWKISSVEYVPPRLNITIGGVYNGEAED